MRIWVDADACPNVVKEILFRAAERVGIEMTLIANQALRIPRSRFIRTMQVGKGFDVADDQIVSLVEKGDLVGSSRVDLQACKLEYSIVSPK